MQYPGVHGARTNTGSERISPLGRSEESTSVAMILSVAGGYLDAFTWVAHDGVLANAQTANVVLLGVYAAMAQWEQAFRHVPPIFAFVLGVSVAYRLRAGADVRKMERIALLCLVVEIVVLAAVMILHLRLPSVAGTLGISFAAALQTATFAKVEGRGYSSVMVTGNLRSAVELVCVGWAEQRDPGALRQARTLITICLAFATGAGVGAFATTALGSAALAVPILLLLAALALCRRT